MKRQVSFLMVLCMMALCFSSIPTVYASHDFPKVVNVGISGVPLSGQTLTGSYYYYGGSGGENTTTSPSILRWLRSSSNAPNATYVPITNATSKNYVPTSQDEGFFIKFEVTPRDNAVPPMVGETVVSEPLYIFKATDNNAKNAAVSVSSNSSTATNIEDNNFGTSWSPASANAGENIILDFGAGNNKTFNTIILKDNAKVTQYSLQYAAETAPTQWITITDAFDYAGNAHQISFPAVSGRYLKLSVESCTAAPGIYELQVFNREADYENLALFKPVLTNSLNGSNYDFNVTDGAAKDNGYSPASGITSNFWLQIDLGKPMSFNTVAAYDNSKVTAYRIQVSDDTANWTDVFTCDYLSDYGRVMRFESVSKRYVRLYVDASSSSAVIREIMVFNRSNHSQNLASFCATKASSTNGSNQNNSGGSLAVDENSDTFWKAASSAELSKGTTQWIQFDLGSVKTFDTVKVAQFGSDSKVKSYKIQINNVPNPNDPGWRDIVVNSTPMYYEKMSHTFRPVASRYVRMLIIDSGNTPCITDFEVYNTQVPYKVDDPVIYKDSINTSNIIPSLKIGNNIITVKVENFQSNQPQKAKVILALYRDNLLKEIKLTDERSIAANSDQDFQIPINLTEAGYIAKIYTWYDLNGLKPLSGTAVKKVTGNIQLPSFFSDGMVLQQNKDIKIWGKSVTGDVINVSFAGQNASATTAADGTWLVTLNPLQADEKPYDMVITGSKDKIVIKDILMGEVWFCSGQSNAEFHMGFFADAREDSKKMNNPNVRLFKAEQLIGSTFDVQSQGWWKCTPEYALQVSAIGTYFGYDLESKINVPIGIIQSAVGGSGIENWIQKDYFVGTAIKANGGLFNSYVKPFLPLSIAGFVWYQGEANANSYEQTLEYDSALIAMVRNWREVFKQSDIPFLYVLLPRFNGTDWTLIREKQIKAFSQIPNAGMAVAMDSGERDDVHPNGKSVIAQRLSSLAQSMVYEKNINAQAPIYKDYSINGNKVTITFDTFGSELKASEAPLKEFTICGSDGVFVDAQAQITSGNTVDIWCDTIPNPVAVRYAFKAFPSEIGLFNTEGLPACPFRTDDFSYTTMTPWVLSSSHNTGKLSMAIDRDKTTRWDTGAVMTNGMWFEVDLTKIQTVNSVVLDSANSSGDYPRGYIVEVSSDNNTWTQVASAAVGSVIQVGGVVTISFSSPTTARYIKITQTGTSAGYWSIHELYVN